MRLTVVGGVKLGRLAAVTLVLGVFNRLVVGI